MLGEAVGAAVLGEGGEGWASRALCRRWPEHLSPPTGSSQGRASLAGASQEGSLQTAWKTLSHGAWGSQLLWHCLGVLSVPRAVRVTRHWGEERSNSKARGIKEGSRLHSCIQAWPQIPLLPFNKSVLWLRSLLLIDICSKSVWKIYLLQIITTRISGHLSLSGTVPIAFHVFISHSVLSATQWRKVPLFTQFYT